MPGIILYLYGQVPPLLVFILLVIFFKTLWHKQGVLPFFRPLRQGLVALLGYTNENYLIPAAFGVPKYTID